MNAALFSVLSDLNAFSPKYPMQSPPPPKKRQKPCGTLLAPSPTLSNPRYIQCKVPGIYISHTNFRESAKERLE